MSDIDAGANRHVWETRMAALEEDLPLEPVASLPELLDLTREVLQADGYETVAGEGDPEIDAVLVRAQELVDASDRGEDVRHDDAQQAAAELRTLFGLAVADPAADAGADFRPAAAVDETGA
jgi:hypothetical protein